MEIIKFNKILDKNGWMKVFLYLEKCLVYRKILVILVVSIVIIMYVVKILNISCIGLGIRRFRRIFRG